MLRVKQFQGTAKVKVVFITMLLSQQQQLLEQNQQQIQHLGCEKTNRKEVIQKLFFNYFLALKVKNAKNKQKNIFEINPLLNEEIKAWLKCYQSKKDSFDNIWIELMHRKFELGF